MKTTIKGSLGLIIAVFFSASFFSCKKQSQCTTCFPKDAQSISLKYENLDGVISFDNALMTTSKDSVIRVCLANSDSRTYSRLNESFNSLTKDVHQTIQTIVFVNDFVTNNSSFSDTKIKALGRISKSGNNMLQFTFYLNQGGEFARIDDLSTKMPVLTGNSLEEIFRKIVFPGQSRNSLVQITDNDNYDFKIRNHVDVLMKKVKKFQVNNSGASLLPDEEGSCSSTFCLLNDGNRCEYRNGTYVCYRRTTCFANYIKEPILDNSLMTNDSITVAFDTTLHYSIRDNVLSSTDFGNKYKDYYHDLSIVYSYDMDVSTILKTARLLYEMNTYFSYLNNHSTQGSQTFLTSTMKTKVLNLITEYKAIYNDDYTEGLFQDIITDLNWAENKTVSEVIARFN